jgi:hypothetical protein
LSVSERLAFQPLRLTGDSITVRDDFLADMEGCRSILLAYYSYFIHETEMAGLTRIREKGLEPKIVDERPEEVVVRLGEDGRRITCFRPFAASFIRRGSREKGLIELAIPAEGLPELVGIDWTDSYAKGLGDVIRSSEPDRLAMEVFREVVRRTGIAIAYKKIDPADLLVRRTMNQDDNPSTWGRLTETSDPEIYVFDR